MCTCDRRSLSRLHFLLTSVSLPTPTLYTPLLPTRNNPRASSPTYLVCGPTGFDRLPASTVADVGLSDTAPPASPTRTPGHKGSDVQDSTGLQVSRGKEDLEGDGPWEEHH